MVGFGFGVRFSRRSVANGGAQTGSGNILYGPNYGPRGPKKLLVAVYNQTPTGYCFETDSKTENLYAKWKSRGVNVIKQQNLNFTGVPANDILAAVQAEGMMLLASPRWHTDLLGSNPGAGDFRATAMNDTYWRTNWIGYAFTDEPDLYAQQQSEHETFFNSLALDGVRKPGIANFTWRIASTATPVGSESINWRSFFQLGTVNEITHDTYLWHLLDDADAVGGYFANTQGTYGPYSTSVDISLREANRISRGRRFTTSLVGMNVHLTRNGPMSRGRSLDGGATVLPPHLFDPPQRGEIVLPTPLDYAPGDKSVGHYIGTGRVDFVSAQFARGGRHAPARFIRDDIWTGIIHGSSNLLIFPQAPSGATVVVTGYVDAGTGKFTVTSTAPHGRANIGPAMQIQRADNGAPVGWIRRDNFQDSGTPRGAGVYSLDNAKTTTVTTGSAGTPVQFRLWAAEGLNGDGTNAANAAELTAATANFTRMQAHPTGGNLLMDTAQGGRRSFTVLRCPDTAVDPGPYRDDMTQVPVQAGYLTDGTPVLDSAGEGPLWPFGWPMGFEGFTVLGDDGATYIYVKSMTRADAPTWFPGYAPLGLPARVFGPFELAGFRRVGTGSAVEMTGSSGVIKAAQDEGAATWFYIETAGYAQAEGTGAGTTTYTITVRRGGNVSGSNTVTATVSGTGPNPANAADFTGGTFPSQVLSFAGGETTKAFTFTVDRDATGELDETFAVTLSAPSGGAVLVQSGKQTVTCTIANDDGAVVGAFVWLGQTLIGAPALAGSPPGAVHLNVGETANVTRGGITMRSRGSGITSADSYWFATTPGWLVSNGFAGPLFVLPAGNWEVGFIAASQPWGGGIGGTVYMIDDPLGADTVRQALPVSAGGTVLVDTDNTPYTSPSTAVSGAINNLTYVPVTITNTGGGNGMLQVFANGVILSAIALRQV